MAKHQRNPLSTLRQINDQLAELDLDALDEQTARIAGNLLQVTDDQNDLDALERQTAAIAANLQTIAEDHLPIEDLLAQTNLVVANLQRIKALLEEDDVAAVVEQLSRRYHIDPGPLNDASTRATKEWTDDISLATMQL